MRVAHEQRERLCGCIFFAGSRADDLERDQDAVDDPPDEEYPSGAQLYDSDGVVPEVEAIETERAEEEREKDRGSVLFAAVVRAPLLPREIPEAIALDLCVDGARLIPRIISRTMRLGPIPVRKLRIVARVLPREDITAVDGSRNDSERSDQHQGK
jgi:hypothetical protein